MIIDDCKLHCKLLLFSITKALYNSQLLNCINTDEHNFVKKNKKILKKFIKTLALFKKAVILYYNRCKRKLSVI